jgi:DNA-binding PadR family transcriptional regulator
VETGSLYPALHRLEAKGWVAHQGNSLRKEGKRARYYRLTALGKKHLGLDQSRWERLSRAMGLVPGAAPQGGPVNEFFRKLSWLFRRRTREQDLEAELCFHIEETAEERRLEGASSEQALRAALRDLGNVGILREDARAAWSWSWFEQFRQDCRYALRGMLRNPMFTAMAALSLALGIGANTVISSFLDALLLRALPVAEPDRLAVLNWHNSVDHDTVFHGGSGSVYDDLKYGFTARIFPFPAFEAFQKSQSVFSTLFAYLPTRNLNLIIRGQAEVAAGEYVSGDFFRGLELAPAVGRLLDPDDDRPGAAAVALLSYGSANLTSATPAPPWVKRSS